MTTKIFAGIASLALLFSCNKKEESNTIEINDNADAPISNVVVNECYQFAKNNDTVSLSVRRDGDNATGNLIYNFFDKDDSTGEFTGMFKGDTLIADFTFKAEGTTSIREVVFLKSDDTYLPGYGDMEEKDSKQVFKNPKALKFDDIVVLSKTDCQ